MKHLKYILICTLIFIGGCANEEEELRIVSLIPSNTEILTELGFEDNIVGVTTVDNYPESLVERDDLAVFDSFELDVEALMALNPTHVFTHESSRSMHEDLLESLDAEVIYVNDAENLEDLYASIEHIGTELNASQESAHLIDEIESNIESIHEVEGDAFVMISLPPDIYIAADDTFISDALSEIGVTNVFNDLTGYPVVSNEDVLKRSPEYVISTTGMSEAEFEESFNDIPGLSANEYHICNINPDLISRPGPRISEGLQEVAACVNE